MGLDVELCELRVGNWRIYWDGLYRCHMKNARLCLLKTNKYDGMTFNCNYK